MKLGFEEPQAAYDSGSQKARVWTERWASDWLYCPNCGNDKIFQYPANLPVADFYCANCNDQYELKSQKTPFKSKIVDGAYETMRMRLASETSPNFILLHYDMAATSVINVCMIPRHFFVSEIIERRKPLAPTARRAGWVGCNILLDRIPESGRIYVVRDKVPRSKDAVIAQWRKTVFLREQDPSARGWLIEVMASVEALNSKQFALNDVYASEQRLREIYPNNSNVRPKIRQQLQVLRDQGYLDFLGNGRYRLRQQIQET